MSLQCMLDNDNDRYKCALYFQNYRNCKQFWVFVFPFCCCSVVIVVVIVIVA